MIIFCILIYGSFEDQTEIDVKGKLPSYPQKNKLDKCKIGNFWLVEHEFGRRNQNWQKGDSLFQVSFVCDSSQPSKLGKSFTHSSFIQQTFIESLIH